MASVGELFVEIGANVANFEKQLQKVKKDMQKLQQQLGKTGNDIAGNFEGNMDDLSRASQRAGDVMDRLRGNMDRLSQAELDRLPDHMKGWAGDLKTMQREFKNLEKQSVTSLEAIQNAVLNTRVGFDKLTSVSDSGKKAIKMLQGMKDETKATRLALLGLNKDGTAKISTADASKQMQTFKDRIDASRKGLEKLRNAGDLGSYEAGMKVLNKEMRLVERTMNSIANGGRGLTQQLREMGIVTEAAGNAAAVAMEGMRDSFINANNVMQGKTTQSEKMIKNLARMKLRGLDQQFLGIAKQMEKFAKSGSAANLALKELGKNASMKDILDQTMMINQGLMRMQQLQMGMVAVVAGSTVAMVKLSAAVDGRLTTAMDTFKATWLKTLTPFIKAWTTAAKAVVDFGTTIGTLTGKFTAANPVISGMIGNIGYLAGVFTLLLSPLAIGISRAGGMRAAFSALWMIIGPGVTGFLAVIGTAVTLAATFVTVTQSIDLMKKHSEDFVKAFTNLWSSIKQTAAVAFAPTIQAFGILKTSFNDLVSNFTGGAKTFGDKWKNIGDNVASVVNALAPFITTTLGLAFQLLNAIAVPALQNITKAFQGISNWMNGDGGKMSVFFTNAKDVFVNAFTVISSFIQSIMPSIQQALSLGFDVLSGLITTILPKIMELVGIVFPYIAQIVQAVMPIVVDLLASSWDNIQKMIVAAIDVIIGVIHVFEGLFTGDWSKMWGGICEIVNGALVLVWNFIMVALLGKVLKGIKLFGILLKGIMGKSWDNIVTYIYVKLDDIVKGVSTKFGQTGVYIKLAVQKIKEFVVNGFKLMVSGAKTTFSILKTAATTAFDLVKSAITKPIEKAKSIVLKILGVIKTAFKTLKLSIPTPDFPKASIAWKKFGKGKVSINVPTVHWNAKGGIFNGASVLGGGQGVGEKGAEAVLPIQNRRYMAPFSNAVGKYLSDNMKDQPGGVQVVNEFSIAQLIVREELDVEKIAKRLEKAQRQQVRAKGGLNY